MSDSGIVVAEPRPHVRKQHFNRFSRALRLAVDATSAAISKPRQMLSALKMATPLARGMHFASWSNFEPREVVGARSSEINPLERYFDNHVDGPGIWKWRHYFEIYHRHFQKFVGSDVHILEVGVYSGGSLAMWKDYFGPRCRIYGVDIARECEAYQSEGIEILIGDQSSHAFWKKVKERVPRVDILVDDGGHQAEPEIVTFEEMFPHLSAGGVYLCEDTHGAPHPFVSYLAGLASQLNGSNHSRLEAYIDSAHFYPSIVVIEKRERERVFSSEKHGTEWQPW